VLNVVVMLTRRSKRLRVRELAGRTVGRSLAVGACCRRALDLRAPPALPNGPLIPLTLSTREPAPVPARREIEQVPSAAAAAAERYDELVAAAERAIDTFAALLAELAK
jgi:hypothetical protein